jgi:site-specific DNA-methyltransferase (adenine-specific)
MARKPLAEKTVAENVLKHGTGGINIDESRVGTEEIKHNQDHKSLQKFKEQDGRKHKEVENPEPTYNTGRFPANLIHDNSEEVRECFPETGNDSGNASRFFKSIIYQAKASKSERNKGCEEIDAQIRVRQGLAGEKKDTVSSNFHPTVKPIALMEYLVNMASREGATVLDPFMGSGPTGAACKNLKRNFIGIELDPEYFKIAEARINRNDYFFDEPGL